MAKVSKKLKSKASSVKVTYLGPNSKADNNYIGWVVRGESYDVTSAQAEHLLKNRKSWTLAPARDADAAGEGD